MRLALSQASGTSSRSQASHVEDVAQLTIHVPTPVLSGPGQSDNASSGTRQLIHPSCHSPSTSHFISHPFTNLLIPTQSSFTFPFNIPTQSERRTLLLQLADRVSHIKVPFTLPPCGRTARNQPPWPPNCHSLYSVLQ
jgi:hypothetical protein